MYGVHRQTHIYAFGGSCDSCFPILFWRNSLLGTLNAIQHLKFSAQCHSVLLCSKYTNSKLMRVKFKRNPPKIVGGTHTHMMASVWCHLLGSNESRNFSRPYNRRLHCDCDEGCLSSIKSEALLAAWYNWCAGFHIF